LKRANERKRQFSRERAAVAFITEETIALVKGVAAKGERIETPFADGQLVWHKWGNSGPALVLCHGGYGSWMHWIRNVLPLSEKFTVYAVDMPGLGESSTPSEPWTAEGLAAIVVSGIEAIVPRDQQVNLAGFSFGGVIGGVISAQLGDRLRSFTVVGSNGMGLERSPTALERVKPGAAEEEEFATHRFNLNQLMIHDLAKIDNLALYLQRTNHANARMRSRRFSRSGALVEALPKIKGRLDGIWGERDATAYPHVDDRRKLLQEVQPGARFTTIPGAGHWVQFEAAEQFNPVLIGYLTS
jgi:pimeloyl-ACP methyl ester carboxylesterase